MRGVLLALVVWCHVKVAHISPGYGAYLNLNKEMLARASIANESFNFKLSQNSLNRVYFNYQCDIFKIDNALVYEILSKIFTYTDTYVHMKQKKSMQDGQAVYFDIFKWFLGPDHVARQIAEAEENLHYDNEK